MDGKKLKNFSLDKKSSIFMLNLYLK